MGDVMLGRRVAQVIEEHPPEHVWGNVLPLLHTASLRVLNLECVIAQNLAQRPWMPPKTFYFISGPKAMHVLERGSIEVVTLANNHTLDYREPALLEMLELLRGAGIKCVGAGRNLAEAQSPLFVETSALTVAIINFTDNEPAWEATDTRAGVFYVPIDLTDRRFKRLEQLTREAKQTADVVLITAHWGPNMLDRPLDQHLPFARALLEAGADCVAGHSAHVFQGIEIYRGKPILYDMGDFVNDYAVDPILRNDRSFLWMLDADKDGPEQVDLIPVLIDGRECQVNLATGPGAHATIEKIKRLCAEMGTRVEPMNDRLIVPIQTRD